MPENPFLHQLLREDQEPFQLNAYIAERKRQLSGAAADPSPPSASGGVLRVPPKTAALLLEAALRIQKQYSAKNPTTEIKSAGFGLFGSILKRLKGRNKKRGQKSLVLKGDDRIGVSCSVRHCSFSSADWSESHEEKSLDFETSSSSRSEEEFQEIRLFPSSPFRFSLQRCESPGRRKAGFPSPAASPVGCRRQDKDQHEIEKLENIEQEEEEHEKEQCSPVSVFDLPFEDHNYALEEEDDEAHDSDLECSYAIVQRAQQQLLSKLSRFEKLAELDPIELERIIMLDEEKGDEDVACDNEVGSTFETKRLEKSKTHQGFVCKRFDSRWGLELNSIDVMVEMDMGAVESGEWKTFPTQAEETAMEIEVAVFGELLNEILT
ncbi:hypothetical protein DM860_001077 [Cuscuta australis]|uniref:DUF4378 domain-containing protein n=1 Tax=Cuscuta australis TaxID=267555 RepID=A0A328DSQ0_9ASTE|nr:hypothetical protein DM860_001077 [Cuscuta australis]